MASVDPHEYCLGIQAVLRANITEAQMKHIFVEGAEREVANLAHMPLINIRLSDSFEELTSIPDGSYDKTSVMIDVITFDFTSYNEAARLRGDLLRAAKAVMRANKKFMSGIETSSPQGQTTYGAADDERGGHVSMATFTVVVEAYLEP
jgi:hypothetical protein